MYFTLKFESFFLVYLYTELFLTGRFRKSKNVHDNSALLSQPILGGIFRTSN